jgi:hypothetical protein
VSVRQHIVGVLHLRARPAPPLRVGPTDLTCDQNVTCDQDERHTHRISSGSESQTERTVVEAVPSRAINGVHGLEPESAT